MERYIGGPAGRSRRVHSDSSHLGIGTVPHGFRSSFRDWAAECSDAPREVSELALAHVNTNSIEAAYRRTDMFERQRALMEQWAAFLAGTEDNRSRLDG